MHCRVIQQSRRRWGLVLALVLGAALRPVAAEPGNEVGGEEFHAKAKYLLNLAHFVEWPAGVFAATNAPIVIGVLGSPDVWPALEALAAGQRVRGRACQLRRLDDADPRSGCQIIFLGKASRLTPADLNRFAIEEHALIVGETGDFTKRGGMMSLETASASVRLHVNPGAVRQAGLRLSAALASVTQLPAATGGTR